MKMPILKRSKSYADYDKAMKEYERWLKANPPEKDDVKQEPFRSPIIKNSEWSEDENDDYRAGQQRIARYRHQSAEWRKQSNERSND